METCSSATSLGKATLQRPCARRKRPPPAEDEVKEERTTLRMKQVSVCVCACVCVRVYVCVCMGHSTCTELMEYGRVQMLPRAARQPV